MVAPRERRSGELAFATIITGFSAASLWQAYKISEFSGLTKPGVFPMLAAGVMLVSAIFILRDTLRAKAAKSPAGEAQVSALRRFVRDVAPPRFLAMLAIVTVYLIAIPWLGFVIASALFLFASFAFLWRKNVFLSLALAIASLAIVYLVFRVVFQVVLPQGDLIPPGIF